MTKGIFITATGTDVGKTYISALLVKKMYDYGFNCGYYKPVLSGAESIDGKLIPGDCVYAVKTAGLNKQPEKCASYIFQNAVSPHLAARLENKEIKLEKIINDFNLTKSEYDYLITEGAGGITCPLILNKLSMSDLIKELNQNIIIIADAALGTINSTLLTVEYAKTRDIKIKGIILNNYNPADLMHRDNLTSIEKVTAIKVIATVEKNAKEINIEKEDLLKIFEEI